MQEVSGRKPLQELEIGKRKIDVNNGGQLVDHKKGEGKKKARLMEVVEDSIMIIEVVEPSLNGAPKFQ